MSKPTSKKKPSIPSKTPAAKSHNRAASASTRRFFQKMDALSRLSGFLADYEQDKAEQQKQNGKSA